MTPRAADHVRQGLDNGWEVPPRLRGGVGIGSRAQARPVSRRYAPVENALARRIKTIWHVICDATGFGDSVIPL